MLNGRPSGFLICFIFLTRVFMIRIYVDLRLGGSFHFLHFYCFDWMNKVFLIGRLKPDLLIKLEDEERMSQIHLPISIIPYGLLHDLAYIELDVLEDNIIHCRSIFGRLGHIFSWEDSDVIKWCHTRGT